MSIQATSKINQLTKKAKQILYFRIFFIMFLRSDRWIRDIPIFIGIPERRIVVILPHSCYPKTSNKHKIWDVLVKKLGSKAKR